MISSRIVCFLSAFSVVIISGCGFHLKKPQPLPFKEIQLQMSGCTQIQNALHSYFTSQKIRVKSKYRASRPALTVHCPTLEIQPLVYDGEGQLRRQRMFYAFTAEFTTPQSQSYTFEIKTTRERQLNSQQSLGDAAENTMILKEMQEELFHQLSVKLSQLTNNANI
ncbi:hypothetical protein CC99x_003060 [Candidatus Berkiella cookevillensis]|uniref:LPS-assembly lipoprotein RlpB n=1 Tax=Candidatus Berkiella cookevillensis TaxID=437022 RepID=A0A0Q9YQ39_9GAMM|nr:LPS assembly lipoprotein LptE [Candidatus Berkiella cookevillensis]MCS5707877.1 hypothetical protein [Candidatus Berkiella cookevillensis]